MRRLTGLFLAVTSLLALSGCANDYYAYEPGYGYSTGYLAYGDGQYYRDRDYYLRQYGGAPYYVPPY